MIKAHVTSVSVHGGLEAVSRTAGDTGTTVAVTTRTAAPIDTVIRVATAKAATRPTHLLYPIVISSPPRPLLTPGTSLTASVQQPVCRSLACAKPKNFVIRILFSKVFSLENTDESQIYVAV